MNKLYTVIAGILAFLLSFFLFVLSFVGITSLTLMKEDYLLMMLDKTSYFDGVYTEYIKDLKKGAGAAGFEPTIYDDFLSVDTIKKDAQQYIQQYFQDGSVYRVQEQMKSKLEAHLQQKIKEQNIILQEEDKQRLQAYIEVNAKGYEQFVQFPFIKYIVQGISMMDRVIPFVLGISFVLVCICIFLLYRLRFPKKKEWWFVSVAFAGAGWMLVVFPCIMLIGKVIKKIVLEPAYFYYFFNGYIHHYFYFLIMVGIGLLICAGIVELCRIKFLKEKV